MVNTNVRNRMGSVVGSSVRREPYGPAMQRVANNNARRSTGDSRLISRGGFMRGAGIAAGSALAAGLGLSNVARATPTYPHDGINVIDPMTGLPAIGDESVIWVYPSGDPGTTVYNHPRAGDRGLPATAKISLDANNVQWAIDNVLVGGTVILKKSMKNSTALTTFKFGTATTSYGVRIIRDVTVSGETDELRTDQFPNGTPQTKVEGGIFTFAAQAPNNETPLSNCGIFTTPPKISIKNIYIFNPAVSGSTATARALFFQYFNGGTEIDNCKIEYLTGTNPSTPINFTLFNQKTIKFPSLSNGNGMPISITNNEITSKNVSNGIGIGYFCTPSISVIADNNTINCWNSTSNSVGAFGLDGNVQNSIVTNNIITGQVTYGIRIRISPPASTGPRDGVFSGNDLSLCTATFAQVLVSSDSSGNYFGPWSDPVTLQNYPNNTYGSLKLIYSGSTLQTLGVFAVYGNNNTINLDDFTQCKLYNTSGFLIGNVLGWNATPSLGCILLKGTSNKVYEHPRLGVKYFPPGTDLCTQVLNLESNAIINPCDPNGLNDPIHKWTNEIFQWDKLCQCGTSGKYIPSDKFAEIIQRLEAHEYEQSYTEPPYGQVEGWPNDLTAWGFEWDETTGQWVCPAGKNVNPQTGQCE